MAQGEWRGGAVRGGDGWDGEIGRMDQCRDSGIGCRSREATWAAVLVGVTTL